MVRALAEALAGVGLVVQLGLTRRTKHFLAQFSREYLDHRPGSLGTYSGKTRPHKRGLVLVTYFVAISLPQYLLDCFTFGQFINQLI